jgi:hypothetical protein
LSSVLFLRVEWRKEGEGEKKIDDGDATERVEIEVDRFRDSLEIFPSFFTTRTSTEYSAGRGVGISTAAKQKSHSDSASPFITTSS